jgi:hypothetical protein
VEGNITKALFVCQEKERHNIWGIFTENPVNFEVLEKIRISG